MCSNSDYRWVLISILEFEFVVPIAQNVAATHTQTYISFVIIAFADANVSISVLQLLQGAEHTQQRLGKHFCDWLTALWIHTVLAETEITIIAYQA